MLKAMRALMGDDDMSTDAAMNAIDRLSEAGLLIREPAERETKTP